MEFYEKKGDDITNKKIPFRISGKGFFNIKPKFFSFSFQQYTRADTLPPKQKQELPAFRGKRTVPRKFPQEIPKGGCYRFC